MSLLNTIPFNALGTSDLFVDAVYKGGQTSDLSSEALSKIAHVGNTGGFRKCKKVVNGKKVNDVAYVCIYTTGEELEWRDEIDRTLGKFTYWGDNRKPGNPIDKTSLGGNKLLQKMFSFYSLELRKNIPPVFIFQKYCGRDILFAGLAVPGDRRSNPQEALTSVWAQTKDGRYQNYKATFTILDIPQIDRRWLADLENGYGYHSAYAPSVWKRWVDKCEYKPLTTEKNPIQYRTKNEQLPAPGSIEAQMLQEIIDFFPDPYKFESCACKLVQIMDHNVVSVTPTRSVRDGGMDGVGKYRVGSISNGIELEFLLEAKRYSVNNSVGVKETSRLISRIKHRQFCYFVTTSYVADQAYKEIIEDNQPIVIVSGKDIIDILMNAGINSVALLKEWLVSNF